MTTAVGVDGCKLGWFYFRKDSDTYTYGVAAKLDQLTRQLPLGSRIFIDIPIGLIDSGTQGRECDRAARRVLGPTKASSVFPAPAHATLKAESWEEACASNFRATTKKISKQTFAIIPKIREVDSFLNSHSNSRHVVREVHPEVCFWGLNGYQTLRFSKKRITGFEERLHVLESLIPNVRVLIKDPLNEYRRYQVARDDILDALVALVVASGPSEALKTLPENPPQDGRGLKMEMVYLRRMQIKVGSEKLMSEAL